MNKFKKVEEQLIEKITNGKTEEERNNALTTLERIRALSKDDKVSKETIAIITANLVGIGLILFHERAGVVSSKALGFILRGRV